MQTELQVIAPKTVQFASGASNSSRDEQAGEVVYPRYFLVEAPAFVRANVRKVPSFAKFGPSPKVYRDKCLAPNDTITWAIQTLESALHGTDLTHVHLSRLNPLGFSWVAEVGVYAGALHLFGTGGKGVTLELAVASGYGELLERVQAGKIFTQNPRKAILFPSHETIIPGLVITQNDKYEQQLRANNPYVPIGSPPVPKYFSFEDLQTHERVPVRETVFTSMTGLAAGNTYEEAFVQGMSEIFERYAVSTTLIHQRRAPTIHLDEVTPSNRSAIRALERMGARVTIKDLSLGVGVPVAGVLLSYKDFDGGKYGRLTMNEFLVGAATSRDGAIERCLTELMQNGIDTRVRVAYNQFVVQKIQLLYRTFPHLEKHVPFHQFMNQLYSNRAVYPGDNLEFLKEDAGEPASWNYRAGDCGEEVQAFKHLCENNNWPIYMRDLNCLGFPALHLFVPALSAGFLGYRRFWHPRLEVLKKRLQQDIAKITGQDLECLRDPDVILSLAYHGSISNVLGIPTTTLANWSAWRFFGLLAKVTGEKDLANQYMGQFVGEALLGDLGINTRLGDKARDNLLGENMARKGEGALIKILPDCTQPCSTCRFLAECKVPALEPLETRLAQHFPGYFQRVLPPSGE